MLAIVFLLIGAVASQTAPVCEDVDKTACGILKQNPNYCANKTLSFSTCPRTCGHCPVECYHCDVAVSDFMDCNTTKACTQSQTCMIKQLRSSADGHNEYLMTCEEKDACDGLGLTFPFGKRDVEARDINVHCCNQDLCNYPEQIITTATTGIGCGRDIAFLIDTSTRSHSRPFLTTQSAALTAKLQLVHDVASQIDIGPYDNLISLATFDRSVRRQWDLDHHMNKNDLLKAISQVHGRLQFSSHGDIEEAIKYLLSHILDDDNGDRDHFADDVIIITDSSSSFHSDLLKRSLQRKSRDVIIISIGTHPPSSGGVGDLATDAAHILHVANYSQLPSIGGCSRDIAFLIDTSTRSHFGSHFASSQSAALTAKLQLVHDVASQIDIGPYDNLISLTTFDQSVHKQWDFDQYMNKNDLLKAISQVHSHLRYSPHGDIEEALKYLISHVLDDDHGDRDHFADDVIIITDASSSFHSALFERSLQHKSRDVIIISVGTHAPSSGDVGDLATDPAHILHVSNYSQLPSIGGKLFNLLCS